MHSKSRERHSQQTLQEVSRARFMNKTIGEIEWRAVRDPPAERIEEIDDLLMAARPDDSASRDGVRSTLDDWWEDPIPRRSGRP